MAIGRISSADMRASATIIDNLGDTWEKAVDDLNGLIEEIDGMWDGQASQTFLDQWREYEITRYRNLRILIDKYALFLRESAKKYDDTEDEVHREIKNNHTV